MRSGLYKKKLSFEEGRDHTSKGVGINMYLIKASCPGQLGLQGQGCNLETSFQYFGPLMGGPQCHMSILRNGNVAYHCRLFSPMSHFEFKKRLCLMSL